jgi:trans-aconitate methyltransferase
MKIDAVFAGPVPQLYDRYLGPILFQPFAEALAERLTEADRAILETASGTGIITSVVAAKLPQSTILATDLNPAMLEVAAEKVKAGHLTCKRMRSPYPSPPFHSMWCSAGSA